MITPLVSLLTDQLQHLAEAGIRAASLSGSDSWEKQQEVYDDLRLDEPSIRLLFLTPEKVRACKPQHMGFPFTFIALTSDVVAWKRAGVHACVLPCRLSVDSANAGSKSRFWYLGRGSEVPECAAGGEQPQGHGCSCRCVCSREAVQSGGG